VESAMAQSKEIIIFKRKNSFRSDVENWFSLTIDVTADERSGICERTIFNQIFYLKDRQKIDKLDKMFHGKKIEKFEFINSPLTPTKWIISISTEIYK
jgi:hypothetical protein